MCFRFGLRKLLIATAIVAIGLAWYSREPLPISFDVLEHTHRDTIPPISSTVPDEVKALAGKLVSIEGYVEPCFELHNECLLRSTNFISARRDDQPLSDEYIFVHLAIAWKGLPPPRKARVTGRFAIEDVRDSDTNEVLLMYHVRKAKMDVIDPRRRTHRTEPSPRRDMIAWRRVSNLALRHCRETIATPAGALSSVDRNSSKMTRYSSGRPSL
jgi:hypothetical protein